MAFVKDYGGCYISFPSKINPWVFSFKHFYVCLVSLSMTPSRGLSRSLLGKGTPISERSVPAQSVCHSCFPADLKIRRVCD